MTEPEQPDPQALYKEAKMAALDLLSRREHSALELQRKLSRRKQFSDVDLTALCADLMADDWLSHERFTESFIRARRNKGQGPVKIGHDLRSRGVTESEFMPIINRYDDWHDLAYETLSRKAHGWSGDVKTQAKWQRFLQYRGFQFDSVRYAMEQLKQSTKNQ